MHHQNLCGQTKPRARDLGILFDGTPGHLNAITDVTGVEVGHQTIIAAHGKLHVETGPIRTGVTSVFPRGKKNDPVFAGWFALNGNGEMTGTAWIEESGFLEGPIMLTNTHNVALVRDAVIAWQLQQRLVDSMPQSSANSGIGHLPGAFFSLKYHLRSAVSVSAYPQLIKCPCRSFENLFSRVLIYLREEVIS